MIIIAGRIFIDPAKRAALVEASKPLQQATRDQEPGCEAYVFSPDPCAPDTISVYELWTDGPSLAAHFLHENYFNMRNLFAEHGISGAETAKFRVDAKAPVYNAERIATIDFD
jgi:quinol monooxygenase YgiN